MTFGGHQRHERSHRVADDDCRRAELFDDCGDVVGVLPDPERAGLGQAASPAAQVDGDDLGAAGERWATGSQTHALAVMPWMATIVGVPRRPGQRSAPS